MFFSRPILCTLATASAAALLLIPVRAADRPAPAPSPKAVIEAAPKAVVATSAPAKMDSFVNPKVAPGKVSWHPDFEAACAASKKSGKPVLLFQLLGKLDDQFC
jgi:hypothetical protein